MVLGHTILRYQTVASTNDLAWSFAGRDEHHGMTIVAGEQTAGRGRRGDVWHSPSDGGLYLSLLLKPTDVLERVPTLSIWAGVGVCQAIESFCRLSPVLKWPNDVLIDGKKVCGILVEQRQPWTVVGVGINLYQDQKTFQQAGLTNAGSLKGFTSKQLDPEKFLQVLLDRWNQLWSEIGNKRNNTVLQEWARLSSLVGQTVQIISAGQSYQGQLQALRWEGITLACNTGMRDFQPETISTMQPVD